MQFDLGVLDTYSRETVSADMLPPDGLNPVILGLFGEVGSVMAVSKKQRREGAAYAEPRDAAVEEFGDVLWYFVALCRRLGIDANIIFSKAKTRILADSPTSIDVDQTLLDLGKAAATLLDVTDANEHSSDLLCGFAVAYLRALQVRDFGLQSVTETNVDKVKGRFIDPDTASLPTFDDSFPEEERIPQHFEIKVVQRKSGQCHLQWNGVFIGDPLLDNIAEPDGYRFHDVFHLAYASILHWSPTFRSLIKQKRKSSATIDESQDGGRAIVVEEGLTAWIFSRAKQLNFFEGQDSVSFDMLKTIQQFVRGYEVEKCPLSLWEKAILEGYRVFRQVCKNKGGVIVGDRETRSIKYMPN